MFDDDDKPTGWWAVEVQPGNVFEHVKAEHCRVDSGALVFTNGDVFNAELIAAYGPTRWAWVSSCPDPLVEDDDE